MNEWVINKLNAHNMSMRELGRQSGVAHAQISRVLSGKQEAALDFYIKIAQVFDAAPEMLGMAGVISQEEEWDLSLRELFEIIKGLTPEEQQAVEAFVDYLTQKRPDSAATEQPNPAAGTA